MTTDTQHPVRHGPRPSRRYLAGQMTSMIGDGTVAVIYAFAALAVTESGWAMPAVLLGLWASRMVFLGAGGRAADSGNPAAVMLWADVVRLASQVFTAACFLIGEPRLWQLVASAAAYGAATAYFVPASIVILPRLVPADELQRVNSRLGLVRNIGLLVGPAIAAGLYAAGGVALALSVDVVTFLVSVVCLASLVRALPRRPAPQADPADDDSDDVDDVPLRGAIRVLARYPVVAWTVAVWCLVQIGVASVNVLGPLVARDRLGGIETWSVLATAIAVGGLAGSALAGSLRTRSPITLVVVLLAVPMPLQLLTMAWWPGVVPLAVLFALTSAALAVCGVLFETYLQRTIPPDVLGRVGAAESGLTATMVPVGLAVSLPIATLVGAAGFLTTTAALVVAMAVLALVATRRVVPVAAS
ncbi:MAG: MFS transporter [Pseudonocardia sp.]